MPFQAIPIAFNSNPGTPLSKLLWVYIVSQCNIQDAPNGSAYLEAELPELGKFCNADRTAVLDALAHLEKCGLIARLPMRDESIFLDVDLPISELEPEDRKRIKASPDQVRAIAQRSGWRCIACGFESRDLSNWHIDHIIPRSVGGADVEENCQALCATCNSKKGAKVHWIDFLGARR